MRATRMAERTTLSSMTITVTVAPLTISMPCSSVSLFTSFTTSRPMKSSMKPVMRFSGMPMSTMGSECSTSRAPRMTPPMSMPMST